MITTSNTVRCHRLSSVTQTRHIVNWLIEA